LPIRSEKSLQRVELNSYSVSCATGDVTEAEVRFALAGTDNFGYHIQHTPLAISNPAGFNIAP
jgi:hypothetical protein